MLKLIHVETQEQIEHIRKLFRDYAASLNFDLCFQNFEKELIELPGEYAPPKGALLLALYDNQIAGCVALRNISNGTCEMKRLYVRSGFRGKGVGKNLAQTIIKEARNIGYDFMRLDTVSSMKKAIILYESLGFKRIESYRHNPLDCAIFMELSLRGSFIKEEWLVEIEADCVINNPGLCS